MERMRRVMERDPYEGLFGRHSEKVKNLWEKMEGAGNVDGKGWWGRRLGPFGWWGDVRGGFQEMKDAVSQDLTSAYASATGQTPIQTKQSTRTQEQSSQSTATSGKPATTQDESVYDPITMRRVPRSSVSTSTSTPKAAESDGVIKIPVKTSAQRSASAPQAAAASALDHLRPATFEPEAAKIHESTSVSNSLLGGQAKNLTELLKQARAGTINPAPAARAFNQEVDLSSRQALSKKALEASWIKEREARRKISPTTAAHFSAGKASNEGEEETLSYLSNHQRNWPLKHMDSRALDDHRRRLLASWAKRQTIKPVAETPADKLLSAEVDRQKKAMLAFESKPRSFGPLGSTTSSDPAQFKATPSTVKAKSHEEVLAEQHKAEDHALINSIKEIYENAYGTIRAGSQPDGLKRCLHEYERDKPPGNYDFMMGQDNLEQELKLLKAKREEPRTTLKSGYEEPTYYDRLLGPGAYTFKMGQDNLEQELIDNAKRLGTVEVTTPTPSVPQAGKKKPEGLREILGRIRGKAAPTASTPPILASSPTTKVVPVPNTIAISDLELLAGLRPSTFVPLPSASPNPTSPTTNNLPTSTSDTQLYTILAYDPSDDSVHSASASSSYSPPTGEKILPVADALIRLNAPAKFLPQLEKMQTKGYDIVSANRKLLVLKRVRPANPEAPSSEPTTAEPPTATLPAAAKAAESTTEEQTPQTSPLTNPVDGMQSIYAHAPSVGSFALGSGSLASPPPRFEDSVTTGYISASDIDAATMPELASPAKNSSVSMARNGLKVRKEEPVFSGTRSRKSGSSSSSSAGGVSSSQNGNGSGNSSGKQTKSNDFDASIPGENGGKTFLSAIGILALGFALLYGTGAVVEGLRNLDDSTGRNGPGGNSGSGGAKTAHAKLHPGTTDRAMWTAVPVASSSQPPPPHSQSRSQEAPRRRPTASEATITAQKKKAQQEAEAKAAAAAAVERSRKRQSEQAQAQAQAQAKDRDIWEKMRAGWFDFDDSVEAGRAMGSIGGVGGDGEREDASKLAGAVGTALCLVSLVALICGGPGGF